MKSFNRLIADLVLIMLLAALGANIYAVKSTRPESESIRVEIERVKADIRAGQEVSPGSYEHILGVYKYDGSEAFFETGESSEAFSAGGEIWRVDYKSDNKQGASAMLLPMNIALGCFALITLATLLYIRKNIITPFNELSEMPIELAKGNLTATVKESRSRYFGRYVWGTDMLREAMQKQRKRELSSQRDKQTLILSLSHDIKTPLSAIKLYSRALEKGLYTDPEKLSEVYSGIGERADEIEGYLSKLSSAAREDFLELEVHTGEGYLSELIDKIKGSYAERLSELGTEFEVGEYSDCILKLDLDRAFEAAQNIMENAIKYGDGRYIGITFRDEEDCRLVTIASSGCTLSEDEAVHIFESFYRGSNAGSKPGSGLGLYIARQLMLKMGGDIFCDIKNEMMNITLVFAR